MAVKVADVSSPPAQLLEHFERRGLTKVADVLLVGDTEYEHACATHGSTDGIERKRYLVYDVARHGIVDLARRLDKLQVDIVLLGFPRQVEGIDGDAVPPDARPWVERHEAIWLGLGSFDDLPDIHAHLFAQDRKFVDERDVDEPEGVLKQFGHLGRPTRADGIDLGNNQRVQRTGTFRRSCVQSSNHFGCVQRVVVSVARVYPLGRKRKIEIGTCLETAALEDGQHDLIGRSGIGRALEHDELSFVEIRYQCSRDTLDVRDVGSLVDGERRRHAYDHRVTVLERRKLGRGRQGTACNHRLKTRRRHIIDVGIASVHTRHLISVLFHTMDGQPRLGESHSEWQTDVPETNDTYCCLLYTSPSPRD